MSFGFGLGLPHRVTVLSGGPALVGGYIAFINYPTATTNTENILGTVLTVNADTSVNVYLSPHYYTSSGTNYYTIPVVKLDSTGGYVSSTSNSGVSGGFDTLATTPSFVTDTSGNVYKLIIRYNASIGYNTAYIYKYDSTGAFVAAKQIDYCGPSSKIGRAHV